MKVTFFGACREVTGSSHLLTTKYNKILLDCGMFQGKRKESREKNLRFPFNPGEVSNVLLSHAHIDHSGRLPMLTAKGFSGRIITTRPTRDACGYMLRDSAHIQESDAEYLNYKTARGFIFAQKSAGRKDRKLTNSEVRQVKKMLKRDKWYVNKDKIDEIVDEFHLNKIVPLYTGRDAEDCLEQFEGYPYNETVEVGKDMYCTFYDAGHILGSALTIIEVTEDGKKFLIGYTGDVGRFGVPILRDPTFDFPSEHRNFDLLIMESTYGDRLHEPAVDMKKKLGEVVNRTHQRGGSIVIPSFAMERAQSLIYLLHELYNEGKLPPMPVYVDSPLALNLTTVFGEHPECYDYETHKAFLENGENPFSFKQLKYVKSVQESMELNRSESQHIVISASGMCESGRILHHLRFRIHNERNTILFVGYQAKNTLGRRILELGLNYKENGGDFPYVRFMNKDYPLKAEVVRLDGFSAHADRQELIRFVTESNLNIKKIALVHGENSAIEVLEEKLKKKGFDTFIPDSGESLGLS